jgi:hypothetical protein
VLSLFISPNTPITTTVYDAQVTNLNGGTADEGITYSIKGTNADKFSITAGTGILTYKTIQTSVHDDTITIVATDVAGNKTEKSITVSVKNSAQGFSINGEKAYDYSSSSVSSAGDVNGDGLDDLIVGARRADLNNNQLDSGKSYVIFGKIDNTTINLSAKVFTDTVMDRSASLPATSVATMVTVSLCTDVCIVL